MSSDRDSPSPLRPSTPPPPGLGEAAALSLLASILSLMVSAPSLGWASLPTALAVGRVLGFGGIGTLVARRLPPPVDERLGLRGFPPALLGTLLLLAVGGAILASELDNVVKALLPPPEAEPGAPVAPDDPPTPWLLLEGVVAMVLLLPVVEEFFFRGVLLQGLVARYGVAGGIGLTALLSAACEAFPAIPSGATLVTSLGVQGLFVGAILGGARVATGSLLAPIVLLGLLRGLGGAAVALGESLPVPGFNVPGSHTPSEVLLVALSCAAAGALLLRRAWRKRDAAIGRRER